MELCPTYCLHPRRVGAALGYWLFHLPYNYWYHVFDRYHYHLSRLGAFTIRFWIHCILGKNRPTYPCLLLIDSYPPTFTRCMQDWDERTRQAPLEREVIIRGLRFRTEVGPAFRWTTSSVHLRRYRQTGPSQPSQILYVWCSSPY